MNWLCNKFKLWLGIVQILKEVQSLKRNLIDLVHIGVDVYFEEPHMILIYSKLKGGQIRQISANFDNLWELDNFVTELKDKFNTKKVTWDIPKDTFKVINKCGI